MKNNIIRVNALCFGAEIEEFGWPQKRKALNNNILKCVKGVSLSGLVYR